MLTHKWLWCLLSLVHTLVCFSQPITGIWRGKITRGSAPFATTYRVEVKMVLQGDSLFGTSYYYTQGGSFFRYRISGYLDPVDGSLHWWDDDLIEKKLNNNPLSSPNSNNLRFEADFNCPGSGVMMLNGQANANEGRGMAVELQKQAEALFNDPWNDWIAQWQNGMADPGELSLLNERLPDKQEQKPATETFPGPDLETVSAETPVRKKSIAGIFAQNKKQAMPDTLPAANRVPTVPPTISSPPAPIAVSVEEKFLKREGVVQATLPLAGDSIELQFFDNAEIDGDSIALFLDGKLLLKHIRLTGQPFVIKLATGKLSAASQMSMVAENLGAIPPNTAYMLAYIGGQRYSARLESTEKTTAVIRFFQP